MLRAVLSVALAAALLATAAPAVDDARTIRTDRLADRELGRVERATGALVREESAVEFGATGARRTLALSLPAESPTAAPLSFVALGGIPDGRGANAANIADSDTADSDVLAYRVAGGPLRVRRIGVDLRVAVRAERAELRITPDSRALVLGDAESEVLTLRLVRLDGRPTVLVAREFKSERAATPAHARTAGAIPDRRPRLRV